MSIKLFSSLEGKRQNSNEAVVTHIDRRTCQRVVPMEVLSLGLSRTGTDSMRVALKILGYNDVYHGNTTAFENPTDNSFWDEAYKAKYDGIGKPFTRSDWDQLLGHCMAVTDIPCTLFAPELLAAYPEAKVILTTRDIDPWFKSVLHSIEKARRSWLLTVMNLLHPDGRLLHFVAWKIWRTQWEGDFERNGKRIFGEHNARVKKLAEGRLLEFRVEQGWEPLCAFLGKPVPDVPFPRGNNMKEFEETFRKYYKRRAKETALNVMIGGVGVVIMAASAIWLRRIFG